MWKLYNSLALHRFQGIRGLGILALSVVFGLTGLLVLSSCDDDDDQAAPEPVQMRGFYTSVSGDAHGNVTDCTTEAVDLYLEEDLVVGEPNVTIQSTGTVFGNTTFAGIGVKAADNIVTAYVSANEDGSFSRPGAYFLAPVNDDAISVGEGETVYSGYWTGYASRPDDETVVICPYVLVPAGALPADSCGTDDNEYPKLDVTDPADMNPALVKYLADEDGLRDCHNLLDDQGVLSPTKR